MVFYSVIELMKGKAYNPMDLPTITRALHMLILYLQDLTFEAWQAHFIKTYPHLHCSIIDKIATLVAAFHEACVNPEIVQAAIQGSPPGSGFAFDRAINDILQFLQDLQGFVKNIHICDFIAPTPLFSLWYNVHPPPPPPPPPLPLMLPPQHLMLLPPPLQPQVFAGQHLQVQQGINQQLCSPNVQVQGTASPRLFKTVGNNDKNISFAKLERQITYNGKKQWICGNSHVKGQHCTQKDRCKLHHLPTDWYNCVSHADYSLLLN